MPPRRDGLRAGHEPPGSPDLGAVGVGAGAVAAAHAAALPPLVQRELASLESGDVPGVRLLRQPGRPETEFRVFLTDDEPEETRTVVQVNVVLPDHYPATPPSLMIPGERRAPWVGEGGVVDVIQLRGAAWVDIGQTNYERQLAQLLLIVKVRPPAAVSSRFSVTAWRPRFEMASPTSGSAGAAVRATVSVSRPRTSGTGISSSVSRPSTLACGHRGGSRRGQRCSRHGAHGRSYHGPRGAATSSVHRKSLPDLGARRRIQTSRWIYGSECMQPALGIRPDTAAAT